MVTIPQKVKGTRNPKVMFAELDKTYQAIQALSSSQNSVNALHHRKLFIALANNRNAANLAWINLEFPRPGQQRFQIQIQNEKNVRWEGVVMSEK